MSRFFTSDIHFNDESVLLRENRPFTSIKEFDKYMINVINCTAGKDDVIYHIGDFFSYHDGNRNTWQRAIHYAERINAKVVMIVGNNEEKLINNFSNEADLIGDYQGNNFEKFRSLALQCGFAEVMCDCHLEMRGKNFYLTHRPINHKDGFINLFGHTHLATGLWKPYGLNVGCDLNHFRLFSEDDIFALLKRKEEFWDVDEDLKCL